MKKQLMNTLAISTIVSSSVLGVTPDIGSVEREIQAPKIQKSQPIIPELKSQEYLPPMSDSGKTIYIKDFAIDGNDHIDIAELEQFYTKFKGGKLTFNQLQKIAIAITKYYRDQGYFVSRAYIPQQNLMANKNVLQIKVIEGNYGNIQLVNNSLVKDSIVQGILNDAKSRSTIVSANSLERSMLILQDTPGVNITQADIMPGEKVGSSDFQMVAEPTQPYDGYIFTDNVGSKYTGKNRLMLGINANSPLGYGDQLSYFGLISNESDLKNGKISYSAPLMDNGLRGTISYAKTDYSLVNLDGIDDGRMIGTSNEIETKIEYPTIRSKNQTLKMYLSFTHKNLKDEDTDITSPDITKKNINSAKLGINWNKNYFAFNKNSNSNINLYLVNGKLKFDDPSKQDDTNGNFTKINLDMTNTTDLTSDISLDLNLRMQHVLNNKNLNGSEDLSLGGIYGIKLYPDTELSAENGYIFGLEAKHKLPKINGVSNTLGVFYDAGRAFMSDASNNVTFEARVLQDVGIGLYTSYDNLFSRIQVAWKVGGKDVTSEPDRNSRILFQAGYVF